MIFTTWFHISEKLPDESGWYLGFKDISFGDDYNEIKYFYFDKRDSNFTESLYSNSWCNVKYWTDIRFDDIIHKQLNASEKLCADKALAAIDNYNIITGLSI